MKSRPVRPPFFAAALCAVIIAAAACADRNPVTAPGERPAPFTPAATLTCTADVRSGSITCAPGRGSGGAAVILGGQGVYVRLASSGTHYDSASAVLSSDVTVENLTAQALGTRDGVTPDQAGVRVFFASGPVVTAGTGVVTVENADGVDVFTTSVQEYFRYVGILSPGRTSAAREWRFAVSGNVSAFGFTLLVAAAVPREEGWLRIQPLAPTLVVGDTQHLSAAARTVTGRAVAGPVQWSTSDSAVATVDSAGVVTGVGPGTATVTATSGGRTGSAAVQVVVPSAPLPFTIASVEVLSAAVTTSGADTVWLEVGVKGGGALGTAVHFVLRSPAGLPLRNCDSSTHSGTPTEATYRCAVVFLPGTRGGVWRLEQVQVYGPAARTVERAQLEAAGAPISVDVLSPDEDNTAPVLAALAFSADSVTAGNPFTITADVADAGVGASIVTTYFHIPVPGSSTYCPSPSTGTRNSGIFTCTTNISRWAASGTWSVDSVTVIDANHNTLLLTTAELQAAGFPTELVVTGTDPDVVPPTLTAFSFSAGTVTADAVDSLTATVSAADEKSGVSLVGVEFRRVGGTETRSCFQALSLAPTLTLRCAMRFVPAEAGVWRVHHVDILDVAQNERQILPAELAAALYPTEFTVIP